MCPQHRTEKSGEFVTPSQENKSTRRVSDMSKMVNNYKGKHHGWKQNKTPNFKERTGISPVQMMWMNWIVKVRKFHEARNKYRDMLAIKGKKALIGEKRQKVLDQYFAVRY